MNQKKKKKIDDPEDFDPLSQNTIIKSYIFALLKKLIKN